MRPARIYKQFITERRFLENVTEKTLLRYRHSFKGSDGGRDSKAANNASIPALRPRISSLVS